MATKKRKKVTLTISRTLTRIGRTSRIENCACGRRFTREEWQTLPYVGVQLVPADWSECDCGRGVERIETKSGYVFEPHMGHGTYCAGSDYSLELRNCPCGSTIATRLMRGT